MPRTDSLLPGIIIIADSDGLISFASSNGDPAALATATDRFAKGCMIQDSTTGLLYSNLGSPAAPSFNSVSEVAPKEVSLASGQFLVGDTKNDASAVTMSGDATIASNGILTIANGAINAAKIGATFPFVGTLVTISPTAVLANAPVLAGDLLATHQHALLGLVDEIVVVAANVGSIVAPPALVQNVFVTAGGVLGARTIIPVGQAPATLQVAFNMATGAMTFNAEDAVTSCLVTYLRTASSLVSGGTPSGTNSMPAVTVTGASYTPTGTTTPA